MTVPIERLITAMIISLVAGCGLVPEDETERQQRKCQQSAIYKASRDRRPPAVYRFSGELYAIPAPYFGGGARRFSKLTDNDDSVASLHLFWPSDTGHMLPPHTKRDFDCYGGYKHNLRVSLYPDDGSKAENQLHLKHLATSGAVLNSDMSGPCGAPRYVLDRGSVYKDPVKIARQKAERRDFIARALREQCGYDGDLNWISLDEWRSLWRDIEPKYGLRTLTPYGPDEPGGLDGFSYGYMEQADDGSILTAVQCWHRRRGSHRFDLSHSPFSPVCAMHFYHDGVSVPVSLEAEHLADWRQIKDGIIRTLDCFRALADSDEPIPHCTYDPDYDAPFERARLARLEGDQP